MTPGSRSSISAEPGNGRLPLHLPRLPGKLQAQHFKGPAVRLHASGQGEQQARPAAPGGSAQDTELICDSETERAVDAAPGSGEAELLRGNNRLHEVPFREIEFLY